MEVQTGKVQFEVHIPHGGSTSWEIKSTAPFHNEAAPPLIGEKFILKKGFANLRFFSEFQNEREEMFKKRMPGCTAIKGAGFSFFVAIVSILFLSVLSKIGGWV